MSDQPTVPDLGAADSTPEAPAAQPVAASSARRGRRGKASQAPVIAAPEPSHDVLNDQLEHPPVGRTYKRYRVVEDCALPRSIVLRRGDVVGEQTHDVAWLTRFGAQLEEIVG